MSAAVQPEAPTTSAEPRRFTVALTSAALVLTAIGMTLLLAWEFLTDPHHLAITRDPAWYTWRTELLLGSKPSLLISRHGPLSLFSGGYRVTTPVIGALLTRLGGLHPYTFTVLLQVGLPVMTALALGAFAYQQRRDGLLAVLTMGASIALFLTVPFTGYLDNLMALFLVATSLSLIQPARDAWGPRTGLALLLFLAMLTHPTTTAMFVLVLLVAAGIQLVASRFDLRGTLRREGPALAAVLVGTALGGAAWKLGLWGPSAAFGDAVDVPPYPKAYFLVRLHQWVSSLQLRFTGPLAIIGLAFLLWEIVRRRPVGEHGRVTLMWLLPIAGVFGFVVGLTYTFYRFLNASLAPMLLLGLGAWALPALLFKRGGWWRLAAVPALAASVALLVPMFTSGLHLRAAQSEWLSRRTRVAMAATSAYASYEPGRPLVFVVHAQPKLVRVFGLTKQFTDFLQGGLTGEEIARTSVFIGEFTDYLADRPTVTHNPDFDELSRASLADVRTATAGRPAPVVIYLREFNHGLSHYPQPNEGTRVQDDVVIITGSNVAPESTAATAAARQAANRVAAQLARQPGLFANGRHVLRAAGVLLLLLVLPGLLAARWFGLRTFPVLLGVVPGLSLAMTAGWAMLLVAVHDGPFGGGVAWTAFGLAVATGAAMRAWTLWGPKRDPARIRTSESVADPVSEPVD
jgi:hypothetical protein